MPETIDLTDPADYEPTVEDVIKWIFGHEVHGGSGLQDRVMARAAVRLIVAGLDDDESSILFSGVREQHAHSASGTGPHLDPR